MKTPPASQKVTATDHPVAAATVIAVVVFGLVTLFWQAGLLQVPEFQVYDRFIKWRSRPDPGISRVAVVEITEDDIQRPGHYPLRDAQLAELLKKLLAMEPAAIAIDLFRDKAAEPEKAPAAAGVAEASPEVLGAQELQEIFVQHPNVIGVQRFAFGDQPAVPPPAALLERPDQVGFIAFSVDEHVDGCARRALLMMDQRGSLYFSVSLLAAWIYLEQQGISLQQNPDHLDWWTLGEAQLRPLKPNEGAYIGADVRGLQMLLDYRKHRGWSDSAVSSERVFPSFNLYQVLEGKAPPEQVKGKVVLVGTTAESQKDFLSTPLGERYNGVMLHAQVVDQLLRGALEGERPTRSWPELGEAAWILAWTIGGVSLGVALRTPLSLAAGGTMALGVLLATTWLAFQAGWWLLTVAPAGGFGFSAALSVAYVSQREWRQRMLLMQLFGRHVAPEIAEAVWEHRTDFDVGVGLRPQKLTATVLFTDLVGFSTTSERMDPESLMSWLNQYMTAMAVLVAEHGGVLNKFLGDGLMAIFGVPIPRQSRAEIQADAVHAVCCALAMTRRLEELNHAWTKEGRPASRMRIGIHTGSLVAGSLGGRERLEYTVIGDAVNTASRLESTREVDDPAARDALGRILVSDQTHELLDGQFETRHVGTLTLRGKQDQVTVHFVQNPSSEDAPCSA